MSGKDFNSPKAIANRIKAKGLGRLRWYCEMCQKQCRDDNGFQNHTVSDSHRRQMAVFAENPDAFMDSFSKEFEENFISLLSRRCSTRRVEANKIYNEFIQDKSHTHMNATIWPTLTDFVKYLGRTGKCVIDETERGWHVTWINRDPKLRERQEAWERRQAAEQDEETRRDLDVNARAEAARRAALTSGSSVSAAPAFSALDRTAAASAYPGGVGDAAAPSSRSGGEVGEGSSAGGLGGGGSGTVRIQLLPAAVAAAAGVSAGVPSSSVHAPGPGAAATAAAAAGAKRKRFDVAEEDDSARPPLSASSSSSSAGTLSASSRAPLPPLPSAAAPAHHSNLERLIAEDMRLKGRAHAAPSAGSSLHPAPSASSTARPSRFDDNGLRSSGAGAAASFSSAAPVAAVAPSLSAPAAPASWLFRGLVVKIMNKRVGDGAYYKQKGTVVDVQGDGYLGIVRVPGPANTSSLGIDVDDLETALPAVGGLLRIVRGSRRGRLARLSAIREADFCVDVELVEEGAAGGGNGGVVVRGLEYEDVCKVDPDWSTKG